VTPVESSFIMTRPNGSSQSIGNSKSELLADKHTDEKARELARFFVTLFPLWDETQAPEKPGA